MAGRTRKPPPSLPAPVYSTRQNLPTTATGFTALLHRARCPLRVGCSRSLAEGVQPASEGTSLVSGRKRLIKEKQADIRSEILTYPLKARTRYVHGSCPACRRFVSCRKCFPERRIPTPKFATRASTAENNNASKSPYRLTNRSGLWQPKKHLLGFRASRRI